MKKQINSIVKDTTLTTSEKTGQILDLLQNITPETIEYYQTSATAYNAIRNMLLEEECITDNIGDLLVCNGLLAEIYMQLNTPWLITSIAYHTYDILKQIEVDDKESTQMIIAVLDRMCYVLRGGAHYRLMLQLYAQEFHYHKQLEPINNDALQEIASEIVAISTLTQEYEIYNTLRDEITAILGNKMIKEIEGNPYVGNIIIDKVEYTEEYEKIVDIVDTLVSQQAEQEPEKFNTLSAIWQLKKEILQQQYNIAWNSPAELNPQMVFE